MKHMDEQPCIIEELRGLMNRNAVCAAHIRDRAISEITALRLRVEALEDEVYHTKPGELTFGSEGWTWKQQARLSEDRIKELEAEMVRRSGLTRTTLGGTTSVQEKARNP